MKHVYITHAVCWRIRSICSLMMISGVAELALSLPIVTCAFEIVANGDVYQQIVLPRHADVADFEIGAYNTWSCAQVQLEA